MKSGHCSLVFSMEIRKILTYRADFWVTFVGQTIFSLIVFYFIWKSVFDYQGVETLNGFNLSQIVLYYLITPLIMKINMGENIGHLSREIYDGGLNKYLIYPVNYFQYKLSSYLAFSFFYSIQLIVILVLFKLLAPNPEIYQFKALNLILFYFAMSITSIAYFFLSSLSELISFWAEYIWSLGVITRFIVGFLGGSMIPLSFFPDELVELLQYTPFPYFVSFPIGLLLNPEVDLLIYLKNIFIIIMWGIFFFICSQFLWKKGNNQYTGVGI